MHQEVAREICVFRVATPLQTLDVSIYDFARWRCLLRGLFWAFVVKAVFF